MATATFQGTKERNLRRVDTSYAMKMRNYEKEVRLALATKGHESDVHKAKANKFAESYGIKFPFKLN